MMRSLLAVILLTSFALAQSEVTPPLSADANRQRIRVQQNKPGSESEANDLRANYQVRFTLTDDQIPLITVSLVTAQRTFTGNLAEQNLSVSGSLELREDGTAYCTYTMQWAPPKDPGSADEARPGVVQQQSRVSSIQGSVRAPNDKEIEVFRSGSRSVKLSIKKLDDGAASEEPRVQR